MKITDKERKQYISQIKKLLFCRPEKRKRFLQDINNSIDDFLKDNPDANIDELQKAMGSPQEIADEFLSNISTKDIKNRTYVTRILIIGVVTALVILAITMIFLWLDTHYDHDGHGEIEIVTHSRVEYSADMTRD